MLALVGMNEAAVAEPPTVNADPLNVKFAENTVVSAAD